MLVKNLEFSYQKSETEVFQGTYKKLSKKLQQGYCSICGGNGSYVIAKPSVISVTGVVNGKKMSFDVKELIRDEYGLKKVTKQSFDRFKADLKDGKTQLVYENGELSLKRQ